MGKSTGNFIDLEKLREIVDDVRAGRAALLPAARRAVRQRPGLRAGGLRQVVQRAGQRRRQLPQPHAEDVGRYRDGVLPAVGETRGHRSTTSSSRRSKLAGALADAYAQLELQQCALLPVELARATNGYIDATAPFTLAKDPAKASGSTRC